jgi:hypothetical protein
MTATEALRLIKIQVQRNAQNEEAFDVLDKAAYFYDEAQAAPTLDHLFGDVLGDLDDLTLVDYGKTYTLEEAKELLGLGEFDELGTEKAHITNHLDPKIDK